MNTHRVSFTPLFAALVIAALLAGCDTLSPSMQGPNTTDSTGVSAGAESKIVYRHLFPMSAEDSSQTDGMIIRFSDSTVKPNRFFRRYRFFRQYKFFRRFNFKRGFNGVAIAFKKKDMDDPKWRELLGKFLDKVPDDADVEEIAPDLNLRPDPPGKPERPGAHKEEIVPWGIEHVGAATPPVTDAQRVDLYVIDSGIQSADLPVDEHLSVLSAGSEDIVDGHGTHVAGIAAARDNDTGVIGVAPAARVISVNVFDQSGQASTSTVVAAVDSITARKQARPERPIVVNLSLGANVSTTEYGPLDYAVERAIDAGVVVVTAAGNEGVDASGITPAHVEPAITVGAYDESGQFAAFSNHGPLVDVLAPGVNILSLKPPRSANGNGGGNGNGNAGKVELDAMTGTSMAAPHVAGAAARYLAAHPQASPQEVHDALIGTARSGITGAPTETTNRSLWVGE